MSGNDAISKHYSVLNWARLTYDSICDGAATFKMTDDKGNIRDVTAEIRDQQQNIIDIFEALKIEDRRKYPRI